MNSASVNKTQKYGGIFYTIGLLLIAATCIFMILFSLQGSTTVVKNNNYIETSRSLVCQGNIEYPFFSYDGANDRFLKISGVFYGDELSEISLIYKLSYSDNTQVKESEARNHASMGISLGRDSLGIDALNINFSILDNAMQMSLYVRASEMGVNESKYFLLDGVDGVYKIDNLAKIYNSKGLDCVSRQ